MEQNRLPLFIAITIAILLASEFLMPRTHQRPLAPPIAASPSMVAPAAGGGALGAITASASIGANVPRVKIAAPRMQGSLSLMGARIDDLRLSDYHEAIDPASPLVRILAPADAAEPSYVQFGWSGAADLKLPDATTLWQADQDTLSPDHPVTLSWDNGAGLRFEITLSTDQNYVFLAVQRVRNNSGKLVQLYPWQRIRRDYQPKPAGYSALFEGMLGVGDNRLSNLDYKKAVKEAATAPDGQVHDFTGNGGWAGFTDKYWLTAIIPDQASTTITSWYYLNGDGHDHYQVGFIAKDAVTIAAGAVAETTARVFAGAKEVKLLERYEAQAQFPMFSNAVDWGWFFFITKPFFHGLDWINHFTGNFGITILIFTVLVKAAFFPLASASYRSMGKMRILQPKLQAAKERHKDDPQAQQKAMMEIYKAEGVNPAGGCLPMLIQIPVFFSLYKVILITIEMRQAPFFGWIKDLSVADPTNMFNLFGLLPIDPTQLSHYLHLGVLPLIMGVTMWFQQKLNPPPPDPAQAQMLQLMPIFFTFMMGNFPAGLVLYWTWNNTLTIAQQWYIQRGVQLRA
jgi:YidC/Oxa1 family membrane protein insertase